MRIFVCAKQVPDTTGKVKIKKDGSIDRASMGTIINPDDVVAVEAALRIKQERGAQVTVITMGPPTAACLIHELIAMGADDGVLVTCREVGGSDTYGTSEALAAVIDYLGVGKDDIVLCGNAAIDGDTSQVGPEIAEKLGIPQLCCAVSVKAKNGTVECVRSFDDGLCRVEAPTPCVVTCLKEMNTPRYMTISGIIDSFSAPVQVIGINELRAMRLFDESMVGIKDSPTINLTNFAPQKGSGGMLLEGSPAEVVDGLFAAINEKRLVK